MAKTSKKLGKNVKDNDHQAAKNAQVLHDDDDTEQSYKLNHIFQNVNPLTLLNLATEDTPVLSNPAKKSLYDIDRESYGRTNYYFTITSPDYLKQLFESEDDDDDNEKSICEDERIEQIETCLSFISSIERYIAQLAIDRMPWQKNPLSKRDPHQHKHCFKNIDFKKDIPYCKQEIHTGDDNNSKADESSGKGLLHQLRKKKNECDKLDLQLFFREMFATKELIKEQSLAKNKNLKKQSVVPFETNQNFQQPDFGVSGDEDSASYHSEGSVNSLFTSSSARKQDFVNKWCSMSREQMLHFLENYSLLSILVKEGGVSYKVTNQTTNSHVGPNYTTNKDFKKSFKVIDRKLTKTYKTLDGFMDFPKYVYNSKETFFGKYLLNSNPQELDWDIPQLLDMSFFTNSLITERNLLYSTVWANFMEGLINHYMENEIIPAVERDVCFELLQPSLKLLYYLKKYDQGIKSSDEGLLPKVFEPSLKELDDLYMSSNRKEQDKRLEKFVRFAEYYIEVYYIPALVMMILENVKNFNSNVINIIDGLGPLFYYIDGEEEKDDDDEQANVDDDIVGEDEIRKEVEQYISSLIDKKKKEENVDDITNKAEDFDGLQHSEETSFSDFKLFTLCRIFLLSVENKWL
ncbi:hypothetical protein QEN19_002505 [Hanseniaspora menglaensis]